MTDQWFQAQHQESLWWGNCSNTFEEEQKQLIYAHKMGMKFEPGINQPIIVEQGTILDIGGGPVSLLLKTAGLYRKKVVDPCEYPEWVQKRYEAANIQFGRYAAEKIDEQSEYNQVWIYNVLQHTYDPKKIIQNAKDALINNGVLRIFEWLEVPTNEMHPISFTQEELDHWIGQKGTVEEMAESGCYGKAYYGAFKICKD